MFDNKQPGVRAREPPNPAVGSAFMASKKKDPRLADSEGAAIGARLAQLRKERGITQVDLASALGVSQPVISEYESGSIPLRAEQLLVLARLLRVSADVLLGLKAQPSISSSADSRLARRLRDAMRLPRRDRDALARTIDAFLDRAS